MNLTAEGCMCHYGTSTCIYVDEFHNPSRLLCNAHTHWSKILVMHIHLDMNTILGCIPDCVMCEAVITTPDYCAMPIPIGLKF